MIPQGTRATTLSGTRVNGGAYTVYAALMTKGMMQPVIAVPIMVGEETTGGTWSYLSYIGLSEYPMLPSSNVVACVGVVSATANLDRFPESLGVSFKLSEEEKEIASETIYTSDSVNHNYVSFTPAVVPRKDFSLAVSLLHNRYHVPFAAGENISSEQLLRESMVVANTITAAFACDVMEECVQEMIAENTNEELAVLQKSFWFYAGIVIAAALLMYLMLRRLDPVTVDSFEKKPLSKNELQ